MGQLVQPGLWIENCFILRGEPELVVLLFQVVTDIDLLDLVLLNLVLELIDRLGLGKLVLLPALVRQLQRVQLDGTHAIFVNNELEAQSANSGQPCLIVTIKLLLALDVVLYLPHIVFVLLLRISLTVEHADLCARASLSEPQLLTRWPVISAPSDDIHAHASGSE